MIRPIGWLVLAAIVAAGCSTDTSTRRSTSGGGGGGGGTVTDTGAATGDADPGLDASPSPDGGVNDDTGAPADTGTTAGIEVCDNGRDDDGDGFPDCDDADCLGDDACSERACDDGLDNDRDGRVDCDDDNCAPAAVCATVPEICDNGRDDDRDGFQDCDDEDCAADPACATADGACTNRSDVAVLATSDFGTVSNTCVPGCLGGGTSGLDACVADCAETQLGLSPGCADCMGITTLCALSTCLNSCISPTSAACQECVTTSCAADFEACAGLPLPN